MTWGELKKWVEERDVSDDDEIWYIHYDFYPSYMDRAEPTGVAIT